MLRPGATVAPAVQPACATHAGLLRPLVKLVRFCGGTDLTGQQEREWPRLGPRRERCVGDRE